MSERNAARSGFSLIELLVVIPIIVILAVLSLPALLEVTERPRRIFRLKQSLLCLIQSLQESLYLDLEDPTQPYLMGFNFRRHGSARSGKEPVRTDFCAKHFIMVATPEDPDARPTDGIFHIPACSATVVMEQ